MISAAFPERVYSRGDIVELAGRISFRLNSQGVGRGERVGLLSENSPEWGIIYLSILACGGIVVPYDSNLTPREWQGLLALSGIKYLFVSERLIARIKEAVVPHSPGITLINIEDTIAGARRESDPGASFIDDSVTPEDMAALIYTSGTTGDPKGVILTHGNLASNIESVKRCLPLEDDYIFLSLLPLHHTFEATVGMLFPLARGVRIVYARSLKSRDIMEDIKEYGITALIAVPLLYEKIYKAIMKKIAEAPLLKRLYLKTAFLLSGLAWRMGNKTAGKILFAGLRQKAGLETIRLFVSGGGPLPAEIAEWFNLVGFTFLEGYGLTECSPVVAVSRPEDIRFGMVGPPLPGVEVVIDNPGPDGVGEIRVRGGNTSPGYLDNPAATEKLIKNNWLHTGDLGRIIKGQIQIMGRAKNLIITAAGKNVYPEEIEEVLYNSLYVSETIVVGRKRQGRMGEDICAIIYPDLDLFVAENLIEPAQPDKIKIQAFMEKVVAEANENLASYKKITQTEIRLEEFEKTSTRKIKRTLYK